MQRPQQFQDSFVGQQKAESADCRAKWNSQFPPYVGIFLPKQNIAMVNDVDIVAHAKLGQALLVSLTVDKDQVEQLQGW
jgi:hypothetical protein